MTINEPNKPFSSIDDVFAALTARGEVDIITVEEGDGGFEIQADQWTLVIEGLPVRIAFLAVDEEPGDAAELVGMLEEAMEPDDVDALQELDRLWSGALRVALQESGDLLSMQLATLLAEEPGSQA